MRHDLQTIFLFGESEKGDFGKPYLCSSILQLLDTLGNQPEDSSGIACAIQTLLYEQLLVFFRIEEEGFNIKDYAKGFKILKEEQLKVSAICLPGVGDEQILQEATPICKKYNLPLIMNEKDLFDYLTGF